MKINWFRGVRAIFVTVAAMLMIVASATSASANAIDTIGFGGTYVKAGIGIPRGTFTLITRSVGGSGRDINYVSASFTYFGGIGPRVWIDHDFYNRDMIRVRHLQGRNQYGNFSSARQGWTWGRGRYLAPSGGRHCATLYSVLAGGAVKRWATACHAIGR